MTDFAGLAGVKGSTFRMVVEEGKVHEFARATRSRTPEHLRAGDPIAPVTFLAASQHWQPDPLELVRQAGFDLRRVLHGGQRYVFHGPPPVAGTELWATPRIDRAYVKQGARGGTMRFLETVTEFRDRDDRLVAETRAIVIETGAPVEG